MTPLVRRPSLPCRAFVSNEHTLHIGISLGKALPFEQIDDRFRSLLTGRAVPASPARRRSGGFSVSHETVVFAKERF